MRRSTKGYRQVASPSWMWMCKRLGSSRVLIVCWVCDSSWVHSCIVWAECLSPWGHLTRASNWSWPAFSFLSSSLCRHSISAIHVWSFWRVLILVMVVRGGLQCSKGVQCLRLDRVKCHIVGAKCTYINQEKTDTGSTWPRWAPWSHALDLRHTLLGECKGEIQNKRLRHSSKYVN